MKLLYSFSLICHLLCFYSISSGFFDILHNNIRSLNRLEHILAHQKIIDITCIEKDKFPTQKVYLVSFEGEIKGIFKHRSDLENLSEVVAYRISKELKLGLVPPTVLRKINDLEGSMQLYISPTDKIIEFEHLPLFAQSNLIIFQYIFGKIDWNKKTLTNVLIPKNGERHIFAIDNATIGTIQNSEYGQASCWQSEIQLNGSYPDKFSLDKLHLISEYEKAYPKEFKENPSLLLPISGWAYRFGFFENRVWLQTHPDIIDINYTDIYFKSLIPKYRKLNKEFLRRLWNINDYYKNHMEYFEQLFIRVLERKNFILREIQKKGI